MSNDAFATAGLPMVSDKPSLRRSRRPARVPLSSAQERLWFIDRLHRSTTAYHMPDATRVRGVLDVDALRRVVNTIVARHEILRTRIDDASGDPAQIVDPPGAVSLAITDLSGLDAAALDRALAAERRAEWETPFDLRTGPLMRVRLLRLGERDHVLIRTFHHIVFDGWSKGVLNREFRSLYAAFATGAPDPLPPLPVQYADFALWQRESLGGRQLSDGLEYWTRELAGAPERLQLTADRSRPATAHFTARSRVASIDPGTVADLRYFGRALQATPNMALTTALALVLARYTGQGDLVIGTPIANRRHRDLDPLIGFFVNMLPMRIAIGSQTTVRELLALVRQKSLDAYMHQDVPFERLVAELAPERRLDTTPLYQVLFGFHNTLDAASFLPGLATDPIRTDDFQIRYDLEVHAFLDAVGALTIHWMYNADLFDDWRMEQMLAHYVRILDSMRTWLDLPAARIPLLTDGERLALRGAADETGALASASLVIESIEQQASRTPAAVAVACGEHTLTYQQLDTRANRLAHLLIARGAGPEQIVAIAMNRSIDLLVAVLAILKAGAAYLPIDPDLPAARIGMMVERAGVRLVVTGGATPLPTAIAADVIDLDSELGRCQLEGARTHSPRDADRTAPLVPRNAAYVLYTSGSTGTPKAVVVEHEALTRVCGAFASRHGYGPHIRHLAIANLSFDISIVDLLLPLCHGGRVVIATGDDTRDPDRLARIAQQHRVNSFQATPSHWTLLIQQAPALFEGARLLSGGEALSCDLARTMARTGGQVINGYGPTEATVYTTTYVATADEFAPNRDGQIPIGAPLPGHRTYVLDAEGESVPPGVNGELWIGGAQLARGYLGRPDLSADRFMPDPFGPAGSRMYRTGDVVRRRKDGALEFVGRYDAQIKLRGFRIELGEVEAALCAYPDVDSAVAMVGRNQQKEDRLIAYVKRRASDRPIVQLEEWRQVFESTYGARASVAGELDSIGYNSSYSDAPIEAGEMRLWADQTVARLAALRPDDVLDIGCGTGLILTRLAPRCRSYVGTDFSTRVLAQLDTYLATRSDLRHVELRPGEAHELASVADDSIDLVVLNSVVQYFPHVDYLLQVLREAVRVTRHGGHIFIGDIRSAAMLNAHYASVRAHWASAASSAAELRAAIAYAGRSDAELAIDPGLFREVVRRWSKVGRAEPLFKRGGYDNELSRFRYDVLITIGEAESLDEPDCATQWSPFHWRESVDRLLTAGHGLSVGVHGVINRRTSAAFKLSRLVESDAESRPVRELVAACVAEGEDPDAFADCAAAHGVSVAWSRLGADGTFDVVFNPRWRPEKKLADTGISWCQSHVRAPDDRLDLGFARVLQAHLRERLPQYMVPSRIVVVDKWPLTASGKLDRRALPDPENAIARGEWRAPATEDEHALCELFAEVLGLPRVGTNENFFDLGGHSLMAVRLANRVRSQLGAELEIATLFEAPTPRELAVRLRNGGIANGLC